MNHPRTVGLAILMICMLAGAAEDVCPVRTRIHNFTVNPSTGPVSEMTATNLTDASVSAEFHVQYPTGWVVTPTTQQVSLAPGESKVLSLAIEKAVESSKNSYTVGLDIRVGQKRYQHTQQLVCASTPYFRPTIDGDLSEWKDAIPITLITQGKKTVLRSYWNKKQFCLAVDVQEDSLTERDAIQFALAPGKRKTPTNAEATSNRYEFVVTGRAGGRCYQLLNLGDPMKQVSEARDLEPLVAEDALVRVTRQGQTTQYEIALNLRAMRPLRAAAGREYCFSLLVHDPSGTGLRDLGTLMTLPPTQSDLAWSNWKDASFSDQLPLDGKVEFGFCSSIH